MGNHAIGCLIHGRHDAWQERFGRPRGRASPVYLGRASQIMKWMEGLGALIVTRFSFHIRR